MVLEPVVVNTSKAEHTTKTTVQLEVSGLQVFKGKKVFFVQAWNRGLICMVPGGRNALLLPMSAFSSQSACVGEEPGLLQLMVLACSSPTFSSLPTPLAAVSNSAQQSTGTALFPINYPVFSRSDWVKVGLEGQFTCCSESNPKFGGGRIVTRGFSLHSSQTLF